MDKVTIEVDRDDAVRLAAVLRIVRNKGNRSPFWANFAGMTERLIPRLPGAR